MPKVLLRYLEAHLNRDHSKQIGQSVELMQHRHRERCADTRVRVSNYRMILNLSNECDPVNKEGAMGIAKKQPLPPIVKKKATTKGSKIKKEGWLETKSEWKGVGERRQENAWCYFGNRGGARCLIYRHHTARGTCQSSRYRIPPPSMGDPCFR